MIKNKRKIKGWIIFISIVWIIIGLGQFFYGADLESRFYYIDNFIVKLIGIFTCIFSIALMLKKDIARKAAIIICIIGTIEVFVTLDINRLSKEDIVLNLFLVIIFYVIPAIFFSSKSVKEYFNMDSDEFDTYEDKYVNTSKYSYYGHISFILAVINVSWFIVMIAIIRHEAIIWVLDGSNEDGVLAILMAIIFFLNPICSFIAGVLGILSIKKVENKNEKVIFSTIINCTIVLFYVFLLVITATIVNSSIFENINYMQTYI